MSGKEIKPPYWVTWMFAAMSVFCYAANIHELTLFIALLTCWMLHLSIDCIEAITGGEK